MLLSANVKFEKTIRLTIPRNVIVLLTIPVSFRNYALLFILIETVFLSDSVNSPKLVIVDGDVEDWKLPSIRNVWPEARIITILEKIDLHSEPFLLGTDGVFMKSLSAGEFISNIQWFLYDDYSATKQRIFDPLL